MPLHSLQRLSPTAVLGLWHRTEGADALWELLPPAHAPAYRARLPALAGTDRRAAWLAARVLLHELLPALLPAGASGAVSLANAASGRPELLAAPPGLAVSLSHSGEWAAVLLAHGGRVGIDVEMVRDKAQRLATKFLAPPEAAAAAQATAHSSAHAAAHYTLLWSAKETLYKLAGRLGLHFARQLLLPDVPPAAPAEGAHIQAALHLDEHPTRHRVCYAEVAAGYVLTYCHEPDPADAGN